MTIYQSEKIENIKKFGYHSSIHISKFYSITTNIYKNKKNIFFYIPIYYINFFPILNSSFEVHTYDVLKNKNQSYNGRNEFPPLRVHPK